MTNSAIIEYILNTMYRDSFFRFYANLPLNIRREIILNLEERGPITWEVAYREIKEDTELGKIILDKLVELKFIPIDDKQTKQTK